MVESFNDVTEAWKFALNRVLSDGTIVRGIEDPLSIGSGFGERKRDTKEIICDSFRITNPRKRLVHSQIRNVDLGFAIANSIWALTGSNKLASISPFNPRGSAFSDDGETLFSAPGYRIFSSVSGNQFEALISRLSSDPTSRRTVIQMNTSADLIRDTKDASCVISLQFLIRENKLVCITNMRSQSALMVLPYDVFLFTMIHEAVASRLGVDLGVYYHTANSFHYYMDEEAFLFDVLKETAHSPSVAMAPMPRFTKDTALALKGAMEEISRNVATGSNEYVDGADFGLESYWVELLKEAENTARKRNSLRRI